MADRRSQKFTIERGFATGIDGVLVDAAWGFHAMGMESNRPLYNEISRPHLASAIGDHHMLRPCLAVKILGTTFALALTSIAPAAIIDEAAAPPPAGDAQPN